MSNLKAIKRENTSSGSTNKLRNEGFIPAILYGGNDPNQKISIIKKEINNIINSENFLLKIKKELNSKSTMQMVVSSSQMKAILIDSMIKGNCPWRRIFRCLQLTLNH